MAKQVIVTGFRAFPGVDDNPSQRVVENLANAPQLLPPGSDTVLLDVAYAGIDRALGAIFAAHPAALVLTGFSRRAQGITLETRVTSAFAPDRPDCAGVIPECVPSQAVVRDNTCVDFDRLEAILAGEGLPCYRSVDAGAYLCNFIYRRALERIAEEDLSARAVFVHLPAIIGTPLARESEAAMTVEDMARGVALVAHALAEG